MRKRRRLLAARITMLGVFIACGFAATSRADTLVVTTASEDAWFGPNEGPSNSVGDVVFGPGPDTPTSGDGSATLQVDDNGRASFGTMLFQGTPLTTITQLTYNSYSSSAATLASMSLQFDVDYNSSDTDTTYQSRFGL